MARPDAPERARTDATPPSDYATGDVSTDDWPAQAADQIERLIGVVRENTTGKAITAARAVVFGVFAMFVGTVVLVLVAIITVRLLVVYLPDDVVGESHVWVAEGIVGVMFAVPGLYLLRQARRPTPLA